METKKTSVKSILDNIAIGIGIIWFVGVIIYQFVTGTTLGTFGVSPWLDRLLVPLMGIGFSLFVSVMRTLETF